MALGPLNPSTLIKSGIDMSLEYGSYTADQTGQNSADLLGFEYALVVIMVGAITTGGGGDVNIYESSDDGSSDAFAAVTGATWALESGADDKVYLGWIRMNDRERYLKAYLDESTTGTTIELGVAILPCAPVDMAGFQTSTHAFSVV